MACVLVGQGWTRQNRTFRTRTRWSDWTPLTPSLWTSFTRMEPASTAQTWVTIFHLITMVVRSFNGRNTEFKYRNSIVDFFSVNERYPYPLGLNYAKSISATSCVLLVTFDGIRFTGCLWQQVVDCSVVATSVR